MDFSKFDDAIDLDAIQKDIDEAKKNGGVGDYPEIENGVYTGQIEKLEVGATKDDRPMLRVMFRITEGAHKKACLFMNRVLYGTKNDANMIASAIGWLESLEPSEDIIVEFKSYSQFSDLVLDIAEDISELEYEIEYDKDSFNSITIKNVFE